MKLLQAISWLLCALALVFHLALVEPLMKKSLQSCQSQLDSVSETMKKADIALQFCSSELGIKK